MTWREAMNDYLNSDEYQTLERKVNEKYATEQVFPPHNLVYNALKLTPYEKTSVVIIGQDPYHNDHQAMGLSFSVPKGIQVPPSLQNIYKEIKREFGYEVPAHGDLTGWAEQGVLLLNAVLTVKAHEPASHKSLGWESCTDEIIKVVNAKDTPVVFMLWGNFAKQKAKLITNPKHLILTSGHPSPLSVRFFEGNNHFIRCNEFLKANNQTPIDWRIS